jgi:hypothetical protein
MPGHRKCFWIQLICASFVLGWSGLKHRLVRWVGNNISEEYPAYIFTSTLKMEVQFGQHPPTFSLRLLAYFPYFEKITVGLCDYHAVCSRPPPVNF